MNSFCRGKVRSIALASAAISFFTIALRPAAAATVTYTAAGTFASPAISGLDKFKLAGPCGNPPTLGTCTFGIIVSADEAMVPFQQGTSYALYHGVVALASVESGLVPTPVTMKTAKTAMLLYTGDPSFDFFKLTTQIKIAGLELTITVKIAMHKGTLTTPLISPFTGPVPLTPATATLTYACVVGTTGCPAPGTSTTLGLNGGFTATVPAAATAAGVAAAPESVLLHASGAQAITQHADGTKSVRSVQTAPVDMGAQSDVVALQFYASGLRDASEVRVQIAGRDVPVLYAGRAVHFEGLDQVSVLLPRSLAGVGEADVVLTVDGQTANPVHIRIQ